MTNIFEETFHVVEKELNFLIERTHILSKISVTEIET